MQSRLLVPALVLALAGIASAQATTPTPEATPAPAMTESTPAPATPAAESETQGVAAAAPAASGAAKPQQRCHKEYRTGTDIPHTVCETDRDPVTDRLRQQAVEDLNHSLRPGARAAGSGG